MTQILYRDSDKAWAYCTKGELYTARVAGGWGLHRWDGRTGTRIDSDVFDSPSAALVAAEKIK